MGRSVETVSDATAVAYSEYELPDIECWACDGTGGGYNGETCETCDGACEIPDIYDDGENWSAHLEWIAEHVTTLWPSFEEVVDEFLPYPWTETRVIARNRHSAVTVSEYMGTVAISLIPDYDRREFFRTDDPLGEHWRKSITPRFLSEFATLDLIGTASNGESLYSKKEKNA